MGNAMGYQGSGEGTRQWYSPLRRIPHSTAILTKNHRSYSGFLRRFYRPCNTVDNSHSAPSNPGRCPYSRSPVSGCPGHPSRCGHARWRLLPRMEMRVQNRRHDTRVIQSSRGVAYSDMSYYRTYQTKNRLAMTGLRNRTVN